MPSVEVQFDVGRITRNLGALRAALAKELVTAGEAWALDVIRRARDNLARLKFAAPTGALAKSMLPSSKIDANGNLQAEARVGAAHGPFVEDGRGPGRPVGGIIKYKGQFVQRRKHPPVDVMREWVRRAGPILEGFEEFVRESRGRKTLSRSARGQRQVERVAYLIGRKISQEGVKARPFFKPAFDDPMTTEMARRQLLAAIERAARTAEGGR